MTNEQAAREAVAQAHEAKAERLFQALLDELPDSSVPTLWYDACHGNAGSFHANLRAICLHCYEAGYDDSFCEGKAAYNEPDRNEGYE